MENPLTRMLSIKRKKFVFDVSLKLELANVPIVSGVLYCKVRLFDGGYQAFSSREEVLNHCVKWNNSFRLNCKVLPNPTTEVLEPCQIRVSVRKEVKGGKSCAKLGYVDINLSEYAGAGECQRRYLLLSYNDNKRRPDNSILKATISLKVISGGPVFKAPPMRQMSRLLTANDKDEGIQADLGRPSSLLSNGSDHSPSITQAERGTPLCHRGSTSSMRESISSVRGSTSSIRESTSSMRGSISNVPDLSELRRTSCASEGKGIPLSPLTTESKCGTCGCLVDPSSRQPVSDSPVRVCSPHSRLAAHPPPTTCSRCSSAYSTMSDSDRYMYLEAHRMMSGGDSVTNSRLRLCSSGWDAPKLNPDMVIQKLIEREDFTTKVDSEDDRLRLYVDNRGIATVTGHGLDRTEEGHKVVEVTNTDSDEQKPS